MREKMSLISSLLPFIIVGFSVARAELPSTYGSIKTAPNEKGRISRLQSQRVSKAKE
jgi:hypothetical protein